MVGVGVFQVRGNRLGCFFLIHLEQENAMIGLTLSVGYLPCHLVYGL